jgi:predicted transcriptional regulator of viral defense system
MAPERTTSRRLEDAYVALVRASTLSRTPGVVVAERDLLTLDELTASRSRSHELIADLIATGRLRQVRRGAYVLVDAAGVVAVDILDIISALTPRPYLVTAGRALQFHGLSDQHFRRIQVLVHTQLRSWSWRGDTVRYSRVTHGFRGVSTRTRKTEAAIATPERAVADSLEHPAWGVTISQASEALDMMLRRDPVSADRLAAVAADQFGFALARRLGFLVSTLADEDRARGFLPLRGRSKSATPLLAGGANGGPIDRTWNVRVNVAPELLLQHRETH